jgi:hypothetical protein
MFDEYTTNDLIRIAAAGGGFTLDAGSRLTDDLIQIAAAASRNGARIIFYNLGARTTDDIVRIAAAGKGAVSFD